MAVDVVADDMTRAGVDIRGDVDPEDIEHIERAATTFGLWSAIGDGVKWSRLYGGCLVMMLIDGQDPKTPLRLDSIGKGQFKGLLVLDRWMVEPSLNDLITEMGPDMGNPKFYTVTADAPALPQMKIHYSRCLRLEGIRLSYWQRMMENLWGISIIERLYDRMIAFDSATTGAAQLVYKAYLRVYKIDGLRQIIAAGGPGQANLVSFVDFMRRMQSVEGITLIDAKDDLAAMQQPSFAGLSDALIQFGQQLGGALQIPLTRLFGQSPTGMNATGESDLRTYYDGIKQQQNRYLLVPLTRIYRAMAQSEGIKLPEGFTLDFRSLWVLSDQDKAGIAATDTTAVTSAYNAGIISPQVAMRELRQLSKISGRFTNITDQDINSASDVTGSAMAEEQHGMMLEQGEAALEEGAEPEPKGGKKKKTKDEKRQVLRFKAGPDGLFEDTGSYDEVKEEHVRQTFFQMFQYTDPWSGNPRIFDSKGDYVCGGCNKFVKGGSCLAVDGGISGARGSCRHWENKDAGDPELRFASKISKEMADYGETPKDGFGCKRCEYHVEAKEKDSHGRSLFCRQGAFRVFEDACCALNDTPGMKTKFVQIQSADEASLSVN